MSKKHSLEWAEYISLSFSCTGLIAAAVSQQVVYAAIPLMISLPMGLTNRQRLDRQIREISTHVIPAAQAAHTKNVMQLEYRLNQIADGVKSTELITTTYQKEFLRIKDRITEVDRLVTSCQQALKIMPARLATTIEDFDGRLEIFELKINDTITQNPAKFQLILDEITKIEQRLDTFDQLDNRVRLDRVDLQLCELLSQFNSRQEIQEIVNLHAQLEQLTTLIQQSDRKTANLPQDLLNLQISYQDLDASHQSLHDRTRNLSDLEQQLSTLQHQISILEQNPLDIEVNIATLLDRSIGERIDEVNKIIKETQKSFYYELVFDRSGSHQVLIESLQQAKEQIVIICPWVSGHVIREIDTHIEAALKRKVQILIGWGHLNDTQIYGKRSNNLYNNLNRDDLLRLNCQDWKYGGIKILERIQNKYQGQLKLKVIGTHEKFLVCDRNVAMVGSHNFLTSGESSPERELGLKTNDPYIIDKLITRFNQPNISESYSSSDFN